MGLEDLVAATTSCEPEDKGERHKEEQKREEEEEERAEIEAANEKWRNLMRSRMEFLRKMGQPIKIVPMRRHDVRHLFDRKSNCDEINWGNEPVDKKILLEKEDALWNAAMEYRKVQNMVFDYDLIPSNMALFPIMTKKCTWYHCNLVGCKREIPSKGVQQYFFVEVNMTRGKTYNVTACITLDDDVDNACKVCPSHSGILHPCKGGFTFGSKEGPSKEDVGATPASVMDIVVPSPSLSASVPTLGNETLGPVTRRPAISTPLKSESLPTLLNGSPGPVTKRQLKLALAGGRTSGPFPPVTATRSTPLVPARLNRNPGPITKRQLELALASALTGGGTSSDSSSEDTAQ